MKYIPFVKWNVCYVKREKVISSETSDIKSSVVGNWPIIDFRLFSLHKIGGKLIFI